MIVYLFSVAVNNERSRCYMTCTSQMSPQLNYRAGYEKSKTYYTLPQDVPEMVKAKANAKLYSEVKSIKELTDLFYYTTACKDHPSPNLVKGTYWG